MKLAIIVVEDNGKDGVGHRSNKDGERQDPSLWKYLNIFFQNNIFSALIVTNTTFIDRSNKLSHSAYAHKWHFMVNLSVCIVHFQVI